MNLLPRLLLPLAAALPLLLGTGCSRHAREVRLAHRADRAFDARRYDAAEIDYLNALRLDRTNAHVIGRLGVIYFDQGRVGRCLPFLLEAKRLEPGDREVRLKLGLFDLAVGQFQDARGEAVFLLGKYPRDPDAPLLLAESAVQPREIDAARERLRPLPDAGGAPVLVALGTLDFRERRLAEAEARFQQALSADPRSASAFTALGALDWARNDLGGADAAFARAAALGAPDPARALQYAEFKLQRGDTGAARAALEDMTRRSPGFLPAVLLLAQVDESEKKFDDSAALAAKVLSRDPANPDALLLLGRLKLVQNRPAEAVAVLEKAERIYPHYPKLEYELAQAQFAAGAPEAAAGALRRAVAWDPDYADAAVFLARLDLRAGDNGAAITLLRPFVQRHPDQATAGLLLAGADAAAGNLDDSLAVCQRLAAALPRDPRPLVTAGLILVRQGRPAEARQALARAVALAPGEADAASQLVGLDLDNGRDADARREAAALIARDPADPQPRILLARICLAQRDWSGAETALREARRLDPAAAAPALLLAGLYADTGRTPLALALLGEVTVRHPSEPEPLLQLGRLEETAGNYAAAADAYGRLLALAPDAGPVLNNLAYLDAGRLGRLDLASGLAERARKALPHDPNVADTLGWIRYLQHHYTWSLNLLEEAAAALPDEPEVQFHLGMARSMLGQDQPARAALRRALASGAGFPGRGEAARHLAALELDPHAAGPAPLARLQAAAAEWPDNPIILARLAGLYERAGETDRARGIWEAALRADPKSEPALVGLARLAAAGGDSTRALALARSARQLSPDDPAAAALLGRLAYQTGDYPWSASLLREAAAREPDDPAIQFDLARADYSVGQVAEARTALRAAAAAPGFSRRAEAAAFLGWLGDAEQPAPQQRNRIEAAVARDPANVPALMALAALDEQAGRSAEARELDARVLARFPDFSPAQRDLVILSAEHPGGDDRKALELSAKAREAFPDDPQLAKAAGILAYRQGDYRRAADLLEDSAGQVADDAELEFYLGMAQWRLKDRAGRETLQRALGLNLRPDLAAEARQAVAASR